MTGVNREDRDQAGVADAPNRASDGVARTGVDTASCCRATRRDTGNGKRYASGNGTVDRRLTADPRFGGTVERLADSFDAGENHIETDCFMTFRHRSPDSFGKYRGCLDAD